MGRETESGAANILGRMEDTEWYGAWCAVGGGSVSKTRWHLIAGGESYTFNLKLEAGNCLYSRKKGTLVPLVSSVFPGSQSMP